jgi:D-alanyl-D-alanine carboxypeptidase (penicillin-binding protein 5/6)
LFAKDPGQRRPIASVAKIMTALLVLEDEQGRLDRVVRVPAGAVFARGDYGAGSTLGLRPGERISIRGLLAGLLLGSANDAAEALAIVVSGSVPAFVRGMNARANELGMTATRFASPHGLDDRGHASARDLLVVLEAALANRAFRDLIGRRFVTIPSTPGPPRRIQNRNVMLWLYPGAFGVKTGYTAGAGYCLIATARRGGRELAAIVLGGGDEVFSDAASLLNHGFAAYRLRGLVRRGEPLGSVSIRGGSVPVVAGADLDVLVRMGEESLIERVLRPAPAAAYPPTPGEELGSLRVTLAGATLGSVPIVPGDLAPPPSPAGPWWGRAAGAVARAITVAVGGLFG